MYTVAFGGFIGLLGLRWWFSSRDGKARHPPPRHIPRGVQLTSRFHDAISVVCYNLLADNLVKENTAYSYADPLYLGWEYRWCVLREEFIAFGADVLCLQEVEVDRWGEISAFMKSLGYTGVLQKRKGKGHTVSNAIFFKSSRFKIAMEDHRSRTMMVALNWVDSDGAEQVIFVVNVHLEGDPRKSTERVHQLHNVLRRLKDMQKKNPEQCDVIICGDFNSRRSGAPWELMYRGRLVGGHTEPHMPDVEVVEETISHPYALQDVYMTAKTIPSFTTRAPRRRTEVDFIWCSRHMRVEAVMWPASPRDVVKIDRTLLPNREHPSDHLPLGAVIRRGEPETDKADST